MVTFVGLWFRFWFTVLFILFVKSNFQIPSEYWRCHTFRNNTKNEIILNVYSCTEKIHRIAKGEHWTHTPRNDTKVFGLVNLCDVIREINEMPKWKCVVSQSVHWNSITNRDWNRKKNAYIIICLVESECEDIEIKAARERDRESFISYSHLTCTL